MRISPIATAWLLAFVLLSSAGSHAAPAGEDAKASAAEGGSPEAARADSTPNKDASAGKSSVSVAEPGGTDGVFLPSEEISEDFAVSFPVDI